MQETEYVKEHKIKHEQDNYFNTQLLPYVTRNNQKNFERVFHCLVGTGRFAINKPTGAVIVDDLLFKGTNIISILSYILRRLPPNGIKPKPAPTGTDEILDLLSTTVFPSHIISNAKLKQKFETLRQKNNS